MKKSVIAGIIISMILLTGCGAPSWGVVRRSYFDGELVIECHRSDDYSHHDTIEYRFYEKGVYHFSFTSLDKGENSYRVAPEDFTKSVPRPREIITVLQKLPFDLRIRVRKDDLAEHHDF